MAKVKGFLSQEVTQTRKETPDSKETTFTIPPEWIPLMEKIFRWYDNQQYPVFSPFASGGKRKTKKTARDNSFMKEVSTAWDALDP